MMSPLLGGAGVGKNFQKYNASEKFRGIIF
jgi:hypothetical protein